MPGPIKVKCRVEERRISGKPYLPLISEPFTFLQEYGINGYLGRSLQPVFYRREEVRMN